MSQLKSYVIPNDIKEIASLKIESQDFQKYKEQMNSSRSKSMLYIQALTSLLHLEELANSKRVQEFNLDNVKLKLHSSVDCVFKINYEVGEDEHNKEILNNLIKSLTFIPKEHVKHIKNAKKRQRRGNHREVHNRTGWYFRQIIWQR